MRSFRGACSLRLIGPTSALLLLLVLEASVFLVKGLAQLLVAMLFHEDQQVLPCNVEENGGLCEHHHTDTDVAQVEEAEL